MRWSHQILTRADPETVVPLEAVKHDLDVTDDHDDSLIAAHRTAAIGWVQNYTNLFLGPHTIRYYTDRLPPALPIPFGPVQSVTTMTVAGSGFTGFVSTPGDIWTLSPASGQTWPFFMAQPGAVQVEYEVGYPVDQLPAEAVQAVKLICSIFYDKPGNPSDDWTAVEQLLNGIRLRGIA